MDRSKNQSERVDTSSDVPADVIISPGTRRRKRVSFGQSRTLRWSVSDNSGPTHVDLPQRRLRLFDVVNRMRSDPWAEERHGS